PYPYLRSFPTRRSSDLARFETDIRTVVPSDDRFGSITKILCRPPRLFVSSRINIDRINVGQIDMQLFEPIGRAPGRASPADGRVDRKSTRLNSSHEWIS